MSEENQQTGQARPARRAMNSAQKKFAVGAVIIIGAIGWMIYSAIDTSANYYYKVSEVKAMGKSAMGISLRVEGKVLENSIDNDEQNLKIRFSVIDDSKESIPVFYKGIAPDMLQDDIKVMVEGKLDDNGTLVASRVLTSCPSRYDAAEELKKDSKNNL